MDLVLEGGGVKGIALVGAISVLEERGFTFPRVAGTSAGAIVGAFVAARMPTGQMRELVSSIDYTRFRDETAAERLPFGHALSLLLEHGLLRGGLLP